MVIKTKVFQEQKPQEQKSQKQKEFEFDQEQYDLEREWNQRVDEKKEDERVKKEKETIYFKSESSFPCRVYDCRFYTEWTKRWTDDIAFISFDRKHINQAEVQQRLWCLGCLQFRPVNNHIN